jgi:hypothetical protein
MKWFVCTLLFVCAYSSAIFSDFDEAEYKFSYGFRDPALYGRMREVEKVLNDPAMKPADFSRALAYLCEDMTRRVHTHDFPKKQQLCIDIAEKLISKGAKINAVHEYHTALRAAVLNGLDVYFNYLLQKGADANLRNDRGQTALMHTGGDSSLWFAKELIRAGAKVNIRSKSGRTALHEAAYWGNAALAKLLISKGAALNTKDDEGLTPLQLAAVFNKPDVVTALKTAGAKVIPLPPKYAAARDRLAEGEKKAEAERIQQAKREKAEENRQYGIELAKLQRQLDAKGAEIKRVEAEMSAIGWSGPSFSTKAVTGYKCDVNNQNCRATYQGGGETGSSYWRRSDNEQKKRSLEMKHSILVNEYDSLVYKYNEILKKMQ